MAKTKALPESSPTSLASTAWGSGFALADEARAEIHKQVAAALELLASASLAATKLARSASDRINALAADVLRSSEGAGRQLGATTQSAAERARDSAKTLVGPRAAA